MWKITIVYCCYVIGTHHRTKWLTVHIHVYQRVWSWQPRRFSQQEEETLHQLAAPSTPLSPSKNLITKSSGASVFTERSTIFNIVLSRWSFRKRPRVGGSESFKIKKVLNQTIPKSQDGWSAWWNKKNTMVIFQLSHGPTKTWKKSRFPVKLDELLSTKHQQKLD